MTERPANTASPRKKSRRRRRRTGDSGKETAQPPSETAQLPSETVQLPSDTAQPSSETAPVAVATAAAAVATAAGRFGDITLSEPMFAALAQAGYAEPTAVQAGLIPRALKGEDLMGQAQTGTGKTAAFAIPILERLESPEQAELRGLPQALVLTPTRELAVQVRDEFAKLAAGQKARIVAIYGGKPIRKQTEQLRRGTEVIVGTPGRVIDHIGRRTLLLDGIRFVVLDEADRMLDIGFRPDIEKILKRCPSQRQTLLLSATIPPPVMRLATRYMRDPDMLDFSPADIGVETIEQFYFTVDAHRKFELLVRLLRREDPHQALIFCRTRRGTEKIFVRLARKFDRVAAIHGDLNQPTRDRVMAQFREGTIRYLAATDVVGRGIDVTSISHIINYDVPQFCDDYIHRVGRTGRMGREGVAYTFVTSEEGNELTRIEMRINRLLKRDEIPGFDSFAKPAPEVLPASSSDPASSSAPAPPAAKPVFGRRQRRLRRAL
ncbi:MAG: DEAD/DEAH box helicase [Planctomycetota bacterium]